MEEKICTRKYKKYLPSIFIFRFVRSWITPRLVKSCDQKSVPNKTNNMAHSKALVTRNKEKQNV